MTQPHTQNPTYLEGVLAYLEERFPWLGHPDQAVSGADTIEQLSELHGELKRQASEIRASCRHEEIAWNPVEIEYSPTGTATVWQSGSCRRCGAPCGLEYEQSLLWPSRP